MGNRHLEGPFSRICGAGCTELWYVTRPSGDNISLQLHLDCNGFEIETLLHIKAIKAELKVIELPSFESNRRTVESNVGDSRDGLQLLRTSVSEGIRSR